MKDIIELVSAVILLCLILIPMTIAAFMVGPAMGIPFVVTFIVLVFLKNR